MLRTKRTSFKLALCAALAAPLMTACVTTRPHAPAPSPGGLSTAAAKKPGTKSDQPLAPTITSSPGAAATPQTTAAPQEELPPRVFTQDELAAFVKAQSVPDAPFGAPEHELVGTLAKAPASGSVEEAALALGLVKSVLNPLGKDQQTFIETDTEKAPETRTVPLAKDSLTLEGLAKERDVSIADALAENPLLQGAGVAKAVLAAVSRPGNSPEFRTEITSALKNQANNWRMLSQDLNAADQSAAALPPQAETSASPVGPGAALSEQPGPSTPDAADALPPDPAELHASDATLGEAQSLADRGAYKDAIKKAQAIDQESPLYGSAQEKVKEFSNRGVQDLRKKAAQAFQSAMPINDRRTRAEYLKQAKGYLEEALTSYPQASQLPTVRDNLRVISRDLEQIQAQLGGTPTVQ